MHEFSIASDIIKTIRTNYSEEYKTLTAINISIGRFSGIVRDSLDFGIEAALRVDGIMDVQVGITETDGKAKCQCGQAYDLRDIYDLCPSCQSTQREMLSGNEITIDTIEFNRDKQATNI